MLQKLLQVILGKRTQIIRLFQILYLAIGVFLIWATIMLMQTERYPMIVQESGGLFGQASLLLFILVTIPGIARRFRISHPLITLVMSFRRYLGITVALTALAHAGIMFFIPTFVFSGLPTFPLPAFIVAGSLALTCLLALGVTSNDQAVALMGKNWKRLHRLVYVIFWFIFVHVVLQGENRLAILIGVAGVLEIVSFIYQWLMQKYASGASSTVPERKI